MDSRCAHGTERTHTAPCQGEAACFALGVGHELAAVQVSDANVVLNSLPFVFQQVDTECRVRRHAVPSYGCQLALSNAGVLGRKGKLQP